MLLTHLYTWKARSGDRRRTKLLIILRDGEPSLRTAISRKEVKVYPLGWFSGDRHDRMKPGTGSVSY